MNKSQEPIVPCDRDDCRLEYLYGTSTAMYYQPVYDKFGNNLNPDMNSTTHIYRCSKCALEWRKTIQGGKTISVTSTPYEIPVVETIKISDATIDVVNYSTDANLVIDHASFS